MITFLGVSHIDPDGYGPLIDALEELSPDVILLEVSVFSLLFRATLGRLYRAIFCRRVRAMNITSSPELSLTGRYLSVPWEYRAAKEWSRRRGAEIILIDVSRISFIFLLRAHRLITRRNIQTLSEIRTDRFAEERSIAASIFRGDPVLSEIKAANLAKDPVLARREEILTKRILSRMKRSGEKRLVYAGGWEHCIDDAGGRTLYSKVGTGQRRIVFLDG